MSRIHSYGSMKVSPWKVRSYGTRLARGGSAAGAVRPGAGAAAAAVCVISSVMHAIIRPACSYRTCSLRYGSMVFIRFDPVVPVNTGTSVTGTGCVEVMPAIDENADDSRGLSWRMPIASTRPG